MATYTRLLMRRRTAAQWTALNEILMQGEIGVITDTVPMSFKIGDGITPWNSLVLALGGISGSAYAGGITPDTVIGTPTAPVFYSAGEGTYANAGGIIIPAGKIGFIAWSPTAGWTSQLLTIDLSNYATNATVTNQIAGVQSFFEKTNNLISGNKSTSNLSTGFNWLQGDILISANKKVRSITFSYGTPAVISVFLASKSGTNFTVLDIFTVSAVAGSNTFLVNKTYTDDIYIGYAKGSAMPYGGSGNLLALGATTLGAGSVVASTSSLNGRINFSVIYVENTVSVTNLADLFTKKSLISAGGSATNAIANGFNWIANNAVYPANKKILDFLISVSATSSFAVIVASKGSDGKYTILDMVPVASTSIGLNTLPINKTYPVDTYLGISKLAYAYTSPGTASETSDLGTLDLTIGGVLTPGTAQNFKLSISATYEDGQFSLTDFSNKIDANTAGLSAQKSVLDPLALDMNAPYAETRILNSAFDWSGGSFAIVSNSNLLAFNAKPALIDGTAESVKFSVYNLQIPYIDKVQVVDIINGVITYGAVIPITSRNTVIVGNVVTQTFDEVIYLKKGQYLAISCQGAISYTRTATPYAAYYFTGTAYVTSVNTSTGFFFDYTIKSISGIKNRLEVIGKNLAAFGSTADVSKAINRSKRRKVKMYGSQFNKNVAAEYDLGSGAWSITGGYMRTTTTGVRLKLTKIYISNRRTTKTVLRFKADTVLAIGASDPNVNIDIYSYLTIDIPNKTIKLFRYNGGTTVIATAVFTTDIVPDADYIFELDLNYTVTTIKLVNPRTLEIIATLSYDYTDASTYTLGPGNFRPYLFFTLVSGSGIGIRSLEIYGMKHPLIVFGGDSITEPTVYTASKNYAVMLIDYFGGDGVIVAKAGGIITEIIESLTNELIFIKPKYYSLMIGTNFGGTVQQYQTIIDFCANNGIELILNNVPSRGGSTPPDNIAKNILIEGLGVQGMKTDIATAINNDPAQGYNAALFSDPTHPNQNGNNRLVLQFLSDVPITGSYI